MKHITRWIVLGISAAVFAVSSALAASQNFYSQNNENSGKNETFYFSVPATCSVSSVAGLYDPISPNGGGGASITVTLINVQTVYNFGFGGNYTGSATRSASSQAAGLYRIDHSVSTGGAGVYAYASTTFTW